MSHFALIASLPYFEFTVWFNHKQHALHFFTLSAPWDLGLQQRCQESELPLEAPAGELSHLQVHTVHPSVSQAEAQELRQVRPVAVNDLYTCDICIFNFHLYII